MADTIKVSIELADAAAQAALSNFISKGDKADKSLKQLGNTGKSSFSDITLGIGKSIGVFEIFQGNVLANLATGAFNGMKNAAGELFNTLVVDGIKAAQESEDALNSLNVALAASGNYTAKASEDFQAFASSLQQTTAFEDDAIIKNAALIQSLAQLDNEGLKRATGAALNLSAALGKDLTTASEAVAKAANGNFTSLNKMGIQFDKSGSQAQSFANALAAIEAKFGGAAASKINTFSGAVAQTKNAFGDLQEEVGNLIIKNPVFIETIKAVSKVILDATTNIRTSSTAMRTVGEAFVNTIEVGAQFVRFLNDMAIVGSVAYNTLKAGAASYLLVSNSAFFLSTEEGRKKGKELVDIVKKSTEEIGDSLVGAGPFSGIVNGLDAMAVGARKGFDQLASGAVAATPVVNGTKNAVSGLAGEQIKAAEANNKFVQSLADQADSTKTNYDNQLQTLVAFYEQKEALDTDSDVINYQAKIARENEFFIQKAILLDENLKAEQAKIEASTLDGEVKAKADLAVHAKYYADLEKLEAEHDKKLGGLRKAEDAQKVSDQRSTLNTIATLQNSHNTTLATIGKAAAITTATIDGYVAVQKALAAFPPPFNFAAAALVGTATAANVAGIAGVNFEDGGIVPGTSYTGDRIQANVNSGEMVLNRQQQANLFEMAQGKSSGSSGITAADLAAFARNIMSTPIVVQVDGRELIGVFRDQISGGRSFAT